MRKTALITGASSGIGEELARIHAERQGDLIIVARSEDKLKQLKDELEKTHSISVHVFTKDLTEPTAPQELYEWVKKKGLTVDYLINNAGYGGLGKFAEGDLTNYLSMITLNISALTAITHLFVQDFIKTGSGKILNVSSTAGLVPGPLQAVYFATKAYVTSFSNAIAEELRDTGITVTNLMPGATDTKFSEVSGMNQTSMFDNAASARKVAEDGYKAMMTGKLDVISGLNIMQRFMLAMAPIAPKKIKLQQIRKMQENV